MIPLLFVPWPTASTFPPAEAAIPARKLAKAGVATMLQLVPSQCSTRAFDGRGDVAVEMASGVRKGPQRGEAVLPPGQDAAAADVFEDDQPRGGPQPPPSSAASSRSACSD